MMLFKRCGARSSEIRALRVPTQGHKVRGRGGRWGGGGRGVRWCLCVCAVPVCAVSVRVRRRLFCLCLWARLRELCLSSCLSFFELQAPHQTALGHDARVCAVSGVAPADGSIAHDGSIPGLRERRSTLREGREGVREARGLAWAPERARRAQQRKPSERDHAYSGRACTWESCRRRPPGCFTTCTAETALKCCSLTPWLSTHHRTTLQLPLARPHGSRHEHVELPAHAR